MQKRDDGFYFGFHPTKSELNNKKTDITKPDIKGYAFRGDLIKYAKEEKYVIYHYERPDNKEIVPKMASSIYIPLILAISSGLLISNNALKVAFTTL